MKCWAGWITSWNQDCWEKYQQPQICRWYHYNGKSEEELESLLMRVKEESEKAGLKLNIQKTKIMASSPITSWHIKGEKVKTVTFYFLGLQNHCWLWLQPWNSKTLAPEKKKTMTSLESILKNRDITLPTKFCLIKAMVFPVVMYGCESWTKKKVEGSRIDAFKLWCLIKTLKSPLDSREIKPVNPKTN